MWHKYILYPYKILQIIQGQELMFSWTSFASIRPGDGQGCTGVGPWPGQPTAESWRPPEHWGNSEEFRVHVASLGWHIPQVSWSGPVSNLGAPFLSNDLNPLKYSRWIGVPCGAAAIRNSQRSPQTIMAVGATVTFGSCMSSIADRLYRYVYIIYLIYVYLKTIYLYNYI